MVWLTEGSPIAARVPKTLLRVMARSHRSHLHALYVPGDFCARPRQERAGARMWVWVTVACLVPAAAAAIEMLSPHRRRPEVEAGCISASRLPQSDRRQTSRTRDSARDGLTIKSLKFRTSSAEAHLQNTQQ